ncbi:MAG: AmmeMemoRadiSam system radical SAM enzyme [bacterium]|nr:AmmeMemoRadiSam system radical SAM enzyme [bacterium]
MNKARYFRGLKGNQVRCELCPHGCVIKDNGYGICGIRKNEKGVLYAETYGKVSAAAVDPMEKKPLYHFFPGRDILSFGTIGCNFKCPYCQNWQISQGTNTPVSYLSPEEAVQTALDKKIGFIAYTYSEPLIWYEWVLDTASLARKKNIRNVAVTNGYLNKEPLEELYPFIDAMNIDVKAFNEKFYRELCQARLDKVLETVEFLHDKVHIELTMLVIEGWNDDLGEIGKFCDWVRGLDPGIPVHFSRYFPQYRFDQAATSLETLKKIYDTAREKLRYVYIGNASLEGADNTFCPRCKNLLVERKGYIVHGKGLRKNKCSQCGEKADFLNE